MGVDVSQIRGRLVPGKRGSQVNMESDKPSELLMCDSHDVVKSLAGSI